MTTTELLQRVTAANKNRQGQARQINVRAGENIFPVITTDEMTSWVQERLGGATSVAAIADAETLQLPSLDEETIRLVHRDNPDQIELLERTFQVVYQSGYAPRITLEGEDASVRHIWKDLSDSGVFLPGGRQVEVVVRFGYNDSFTERDIPTLKRKVREYLNRKQWDYWQKPELATPDMVDAEEIPFETHVYGTCQITSQTLEAYAVLTAYRYWSSDPIQWRWQWYLERAKADEARAQAQTELSKWQQTERDKREVESAKVPAEAAQNRVRSLCDKHYYNDQLARELRNRMSDRRYASLPSTAQELRQWTTDTNSLCEEVDAAVAELQRLEERRQTYHAVVGRLGYAEAYLLVQADGTVSVNCGKSSKVGAFEVTPSLGERQYCDVSPDYEGKCRSWQSVPLGQKIVVRDYSGAGNLKSEVDFQVTDGLLMPGVWAITEDDDGICFYPVIHYKDGREVIPEKMEVVHGPQPSEEEKKAEGMAALLSKFGAPEPKRKKK